MCCKKDLANREEGMEWGVGTVGKVESGMVKA